MNTARKLITLLSLCSSVPGMDVRPSKEIDTHRAPIYWDDNELPISWSPWANSYWMCRNKPRYDRYGWTGKPEFYVNHGDVVKVQYFPDLGRYMVVWVESLPEVPKVTE